MKKITKDEIITLRVNKKQKELWKKIARKNKVKLTTLIEYCVEFYVHKDH